MSVIEVTLWIHIHIYYMQFCTQDFVVHSYKPMRCIFIFFDVSRTFDRVWHKVVLQKIKVHRIWLVVDGGGGTKIGALDLRDMGGKIQKMDWVQLQTKRYESSLTYQLSYTSKSSYCYTYIHVGPHFVLMYIHI